MASYKQRRARGRSQEFGYIPQIRVPRSRYDRSHGHSTTFDGDYLIPVVRDLLMPGDTINLSMRAFIRMADLVRPFMTNVELAFHVYVTPIRLVFPLIEKMWGAQDNPGDSTSYVLPTMTSPAGGYAHDDLQAYWGVRQGVAGLQHHCLFDRAYNRIWRDHYKDQDLDDDPTLDTGESASLPANHVLLRRRKKRDRYTTARPWLQKGPAVELPLGTQAPLAGGEFVTRTGSGDPKFGSAFGSPTPQSLSVSSTGSQESVWINAGSFTPGALQYDSGLEVDFTGTTAYADLSDATAATLVELRESIAVQRQYERDARSGTRFVEVIKANWGVDSPDQRLQRPEYIGGATFPIYVNPIAQTSKTDGADVLGNLAAQGVAYHETRPIVRSIVEPSILIGLVSTRQDLVYQQRVPRDMSYSTRWDFPWPEFQNLSEEAILNKELYAQGTSADDDVFGYAPRYSSWRTMESMITGKFNSDDPASLDEWTLAQDFSSLPTLSSDFVEEDAPYDRVVTVPSEPEFKADMYFNYKVVRALALDSSPGLWRL